MDELTEAAKIFQKMLDYEYRLILGYKKTNVKITLAFQPEDFAHLAGLQYIDSPVLRRNRSAIFRDIISGNITLGSLQNKIAVSEKLHNRIHFLSELENFLDSENLIFKFQNNNFGTFYSRISADYIIKSNTLNIEVPLYYFVKMHENGKFYGISFFPEKERDYTARQKRFSLMYKEKVNILTGEKIIQSNKQLSREVTLQEYDILKHSDLNVTVQSQTESGVCIRYFASDEQAVSGCLLSAKKVSEREYLFKSVTNAELRKLQASNITFELKRTEKGIVIRYSPKLTEQIEKTLSPPRGKQEQKPHIKR